MASFTLAYAHVYISTQANVRYHCMSVFKLRLPQDKGKKNPFLAFTFHLSMEFYLGLGEETPPTQAERLFRCMYRRKGTRNDGTLFTPQEFSVACVRLYHGGDFTAHFREYVGCVVGPLPKLLHVELGSLGLKAAAGRVTFYLEGTPRRRVVYEFSAAALSNGVHYTTIIGTRSGVVLKARALKRRGHMCQRPVLRRSATRVMSLKTPRWRTERHSHRSSVV